MLHLFWNWKYKWRVPAGNLETYCPDHTVERPMNFPDTLQNVTEGEKKVYRMSVSGNVNFGQLTYTKIARCVLTGNQRKASRVFDRKKAGIQKEMLREAGSGLVNRRIAVNNDSSAIRRSCSSEENCARK